MDFDFKDFKELINSSLESLKITKESARKKLNAMIKEKMPEKKEISNQMMSLYFNCKRKLPEEYIPLLAELLEIDENELYEKYNSYKAFYGKEIEDNSEISNIEAEKKDENLDEILKKEIRKELGLIFSELLQKNVSPENLEGVVEGEDLPEYMAQKKEKPLTDFQLSYILQVKPYQLMKYKNGIDEIPQSVLERLKNIYTDTDKFEILSGKANNPIVVERFKFFVEKIIKENPNDDNINSLKKELENDEISLFALKKCSMLANIPYERMIQPTLSADEIEIGEFLFKKRVKKFDSGTEIGDALTEFYPAFCMSKWIPYLGLPNEKEKLELEKCAEKIKISLPNLISTLISETEKIFPEIKIDFKGDLK